MEMRPCGQCTACCVAPSVEEIAKPCWEKCVHLGSAPKACGIYEDRPKACRKFNCAWRTSPHLPSRFRPDRCGFVLVGLEQGGLAVWELDDREWEGSRFQRHISHYKVKVIVRRQ